MSKSTRRRANAASEPEPELEKGIRGLKRLAKCILIVLLAILVVDIYWVSEDIYSDCFRNAWSRKAQRYMCDADWSALLDHATARLQERPDDERGLWSKAVALYHLKDYSRASETFLLAKRAAPDWSERVEPYLEMCRQELGAPAK